MLYHLSYSFLSGSYQSYSCLACLFCTYTISIYDHLCAENIYSQYTCPLTHIFHVSFYDCHSNLGPHTYFFPFFTPSPTTPLVPSIKHDFSSRYIASTVLFTSRQKVSLTSYLYHYMNTSVRSTQVTEDLLTCKEVMLANMQLSVILKQ